MRWATRNDIPAIAKLLQANQAVDGRPRISEPEIAALMIRGEIVVLASKQGELLGAACLTTAGGHGHLAFLVTAPDAVDVEARIRSVVGAISESESCEPTFAPAFRHAS